MSCNNHERRLIIGILEAARNEPGRFGYELAAIDLWIDKVEREFPYPAMSMLDCTPALVSAQKGR